MKRAICSILIGLGVGASAFMQLAHAQPTYPNKTIEFIVPSGAGGGADTSARLLANYVSKKKGVTINVVNKTGGGFIIGTNYVMTSAPDGYTMLADSHGFSTLLAIVSPSLPFDWRKRTWIAKISHDIPIYLVQADSPWKSLSDVAEFAKANPGKMRWATAGPSGISTAAIVQFFGKSGIPPANVTSTHVVLKSGAEVIAALAGGHIEFAAQQTSEATGMIQSGKIRALGVVSKERLSEIPDVPTVAEAKYPALDVVGWHGLSGPPGLPPHIAKFWLDVTQEASKDPDFIDALLKANKVPAYLSNKEFEAFAEHEHGVYEGVFEYMKKK
jgi:tripartite-type tricarboxylate transporter receptor subunit TctC